MSDKYKYHCQRQAKAFADSIIPIPDDYPLKEGLGADFRVHFNHLCDIAKNIYLDMTNAPESYGLMLVDITETDTNSIRDGYRSIHRFADTLSRLSQCGELKDHQLIVSLEAFQKAVKKGGGAVSQPIPKYELVLSRLIELGFVISDFNGKPFDKKLDSFIVEFPDEPMIIDTIQSYCKCWDVLKNDRTSIKIWPKEFHHHFYRFDYKITAKCDEIPMIQWLKDESCYQGYSPALSDFSIAFYEYACKYKRLKFDGDYYFKSKRICRIFHAGEAPDGKNIFKLSMKLKDMDRYQSEIELLPEGIRKAFSGNCCFYCGFQGSTKEHCKYRLHWTFHNEPHVGCAFSCFEFDDFDIAHIPYYFRLLELEYKMV